MKRQGRIIREVHHGLETPKCELSDLRNYIRLWEHRTHDRVLLHQYLYHLIILLYVNYMDYYNLTMLHVQPLRLYF